MKENYSFTINNEIKDDKNQKITFESLKYIKLSQSDSKLRNSY